MANNLIIVFYIEKALIESFDFHNLLSFERCMLSKLNKSIDYFINKPKEEIEKNPNMPGLLEDFYNKKINETNIKKSISIDLIEKDFSILFDYNKFNNIDENIDIIEIQSNFSKILYLQSVKIEKYIEWSFEIIKYLKLSVYEENMSFLMKNNVNYLSYKHIKNTFIIKNLKFKIINF